MDLIKWIITNWEVLLLPIGGAISWFFSKRHYETRELKQSDANIDGTMIENISKNLDLYQRMLEDIDNRKEKAEKLVEKLEIEKQNLKKQISSLIKDLEDCQKFLNK